MHRNGFRTHVRCGTNALLRRWKSEIGSNGCMRGIVSSDVRLHEIVGADFRCNELVVTDHRLQIGLSSTRRRPLRHDSIESPQRRGEWRRDRRPGRRSLRRLVFIAEFVDRCDRGEVVRSDLRRRRRRRNCGRNCCGRCWRGYCCSRWLLARRTPLTSASVAKAAKVTARTRIAQLPAINAWVCAT